MKVAVLFWLMLAAALAERSGPYLPSGWRPKGPAFLLPTETEKPSNVLKAELEPVGSDFLREYGPPKLQEVSQDITKQELPEIATERSFVIIDAKSDLKVDVNELNQSEAKSSEKESEVIAVNIGNDVQSNLEYSNDVDSNVKTAEINQEVIEGKEEYQTAEVNNAGQEVNNIAEALTKLENVIMSKQALADDEVAVEGKSAQPISPILAVRPETEGFLEYGPPKGFEEYGPPKEDVIPLGRSGKSLAESTTEAITEPVSDSTSEDSTTIETSTLALNNARRRRFLPRSLRRNH